MDEQIYRFRGIDGVTHELKGDPSVLTLDDVGGEIGKQGGQKWSPSGVRFRVGTREYGERDYQKSFRDLGIGTNELIEVLEPVTS